MTLHKDSVVVGSFDDNGQQVITIYDLENQFIEFSTTLFRSGRTEYISSIFSQWDSLLVVTRSHSVFLFQEKDLMKKLSSLYENHEFSLALLVAQKSGMDCAGLLDIHRR